MKVCYTMATADLTGATRSLLDLIDYDIQCKIDVIVILIRKHFELEKILKEKNIKYYIVSYTSDCYNHFIKVPLKIILNKLAEMKLISILKQEQVDILHNNSVISLTGMKAANKLKIPYVCHIRELIKEGMNLKMISYKQHCKYVNQSTATITVSDYVEKYYKNLFNLENNFTFFDGLNCDNYKIKKRKFGKYKNNILFVGIHSPQKGQMDALQALNILVNQMNQKDIQLTFVGDVLDSHYYSQLLDFCKSNNLENNVKFEKFMINLKEVRKNNDIAVVCSANEAMGRVTPEAMLSRQLVIGADSGGTSEIINDGYNGYLYKLHDAHDLANKILCAIDDEQKSNVLAGNGYEYACKNFDNQIQNSKVIDIYEKILANYDSF